MPRVYGSLQQVEPLEIAQRDFSEAEWPYDGTAQKTIVQVNSFQNRPAPPRTVLKRANKMRNDRDLRASRAFLYLYGCFEKSCLY